MLTPSESVTFIAKVRLDLGESQGPIELEFPSTLHFPKGLDLEKLPSHQVAALELQTVAGHYVGACKQRDEYFRQLGDALALNKQLTDRMARRRQRAVKY